MRFPSHLSARQVAELVGGDLVGPADISLAGIAPPAEAGPGDLVLVAADQAARAAAARPPGAVLVEPRFARSASRFTAQIVVDDAPTALARLAAALDPARASAPGIHPTARIGAGTRWDGRVTVGPHAVLGRAVRLGADCVIGNGAVIEDHAVLGDHVRVDAHAVVHRGVVVGRRSVIHAGARVGGSGFGFRRRTAGHERLPQIGGCVIGDDVEIGANTTVDRGSIGDTVIGDGTKIDNLVQVAHNVRIGRHCIVMAQVGIAGSSTIEDDVLLAGQAGIADHLRVGAGAQVAAQSGVIGNIPAGATVSGYPARDHRSVLRQAAALARLAPRVARLERLANGHG
jgi:UDP-3-O-[3-hydroxymyristoyl] glucosamine N-acyltransferase